MLKNYSLLTLSLFEIKGVSSGRIDVDTIGIKPIITNKTWV